MTATGPEERHGAVSGEGQLGVRDRVCSRGRWAWNRMPRAVGTAPSAGVREALDITLRHRVWLLGGAVWNPELVSVILVGLFQVGIFCDSVVLEMPVV